MCELLCRPHPFQCMTKQVGMILRFYFMHSYLLCASVLTRLLGSTEVYHVLGFKCNTSTCIEHTHVNLFIILFISCAWKSPMTMTRIAVSSTNKGKFCASLWESKREYRAKEVLALQCKWFQCKGYPVSWGTFCMEMTFELCLEDFWSAWLTWITLQLIESETGS